MDYPAELQAIGATLKAALPWLTGGLAGTILTLLAKARYDRHHSRIINLASDLRRFTLDTEGSSDILPKENLNVAYKGQDYRNLALYTLVIENVGYGSIVDPVIGAIDLTSPLESTT